MNHDDGKTTLDRSGFRPDQEAQIARQYTSAERPSIKVLAAAWNVSPGRIQAALQATNTPARPRGTRAARRTL